MTSESAITRLQSKSPFEESFHAGVCRCLSQRGGAEETGSKHLQLCAVFLFKKPLLLYGCPAGELVHSLSLWTSNENSDCIIKYLTARDLIPAQRESRCVCVYLKGSNLG